MPTITDLTSNPSYLTITWDDGQTSDYPWIWLRDHSHDEQTLHPVTQQRNLHTASVDRDLTAIGTKVNGDELQVEWAGDPQPSSLPVGFLAKYRKPRAATARLAVEPVLWDATMILPTPSTPYEDIMGSDDGLRDWLAKVARFGFALATGTPANSEATEGLARRVGYVRESIFGGFWEFTADLSKADTAYTNIELLAHNDGTYSHDAPGLQMLHCLYFDGTGGDSTMADGFRVAQELKDSAPEHYDTLSRVAVPGQYVGDGSHLMAARPVFRHDHTGSLVQVSFNNGDRAPFLLPPDEMVAFYDAIRAFDQLANDHRLQWRHVLAPGEAMLFDNWRAMHGRAAYTGKRTMCGAYLNHEDFESRLRMLGAG
jgi:trimethyllysine dioxygenase